MNTSMFLVTQDEDRVKVSVEFRFHRSHKLQCFFKVSRSRGKSRENGAISLALKKIVRFHWLFIILESRARLVQGPCQVKVETTENLTWAKLC